MREGERGRENKIRFIGSYLDEERDKERQREAERERERDRE